MNPFDKTAAQSYQNRTGQRAQDHRSPFVKECDTPNFYSGREAHRPSVGVLQSTLTGRPDSAELERRKKNGCKRANVVEQEGQDQPEPDRQTKAESQHQNVAIN